VDPQEVRRSLLSAVDQFTVKCRMPQLQNSMTTSTAPAEQSSVLLAAVSLIHYTRETWSLMHCSAGDIRCTQ
jgi:hypothetical protein